MVAEHLVEILRCPQDRTRLRLADAALVAQLNELIVKGLLTNAAGEPVAKQFDSGLIREAGDLLYPVIDQIPVMLPDEAIRLPL